MAGNPYNTRKVDRVERISEENLEAPLIEGDASELEGTARPEKPQVLQMIPTIQPTAAANASTLLYQPGSRNWHPISEYYEDDHSTIEDDTSYTDAEEGRTTSPVRVDVTAGHPSVVDYRVVGHGRIVDNHFSGSRGTHSRTEYKPYRIVELVLGVKVTPTASGVLEVEQTVVPDSQNDQRDQAGVPIVQSSLEKDTQPSEAAARTSSPRSMRLPLTSHPVQPDADTSIRRSKPEHQSKRVSYEIPPIDLNGPKNFSRQKIATTPYPPIKQLTPGTSALNGKRNAHSLVLCLFGHNQSSPRYARLIVPVHENQSDKANAKEVVQGSQTRGYDDERLFLDMHKEYQTFRGPIRRLLSMQRLKSLKLISWAPSMSMGVYEYRDRNILSLYHSSIPQKIWERFQNPRSGRGRYEWVDWVHQSSQENSSSLDDGPEEIAVEFVEGWSVWRIVLLAAVMWLLSLAAGILWIILGIDPEGRRGWNSAGARVNTGVLFSGVILMLGWSLVAAWAALSWLTS